MLVQPHICLPVLEPTLDEVLELVVSNMHLLECEVVIGHPRRLFSPSWRRTWADNAI